MVPSTFSSWMSRPGDGQLLRAEAEFAELAGDGIALQLRVVGVDLGLVAANERRLLDASAAHVHQGERAVLVAHGELALRAFGHIIDFAGGKIGDIGFRAATKAVAFLRLLAGCR